MQNKKLKILMIKKGIKNVQMARDLGICDSRFSKMVNGWISIPDNLKPKIASYLGVPENEVFSEESNSIF